MESIGESSQTWKFFDLILLMFKKPWLGVKTSSMGFF
jgi:hypothetical protein